MYAGAQVVQPVAKLELRISYAGIAIPQAHFDLLLSSPPPSGPLIVFDPDYQAVLNQGTALGYVLPSSPNQILQNQLVIDLKAAGIWALLDIFYVFATDASREFARLNWKSPTVFPCLEVGVVTFTADQGFAGNGVNSYLNTQWDPANNGVNYGQVASAFVYCVNDLAQNGHSFGFVSAGNVGRTRLVPRTAGNRVQGRINQTASSDRDYAANVDGSGLYELNRRNFSFHRVYKNGVLQGSESPEGASALSTADCFIGCENINGTAGNFSSRTHGMFGTGGSLDAAALHDDLNTIWMTYFNSL